MASPGDRFVWYELMTTDVEACKVFYSKLMGWGARDSPTRRPAYALFTARNAPVAGLTSLPEGARRAGAVPNWIGYVAVADVDAAVARTRELGGTVHVPPTDIPGINRFAMIADPQMAAVALAKGRRGEPQSPDLLAPGRVGWHELLAADWETVFSFYERLFGWQKGESHFGAMGSYQQFSAGGEAIGGMFTKPASLPVPFWLYYFNVRDLDVAARRVTAGGGEILYGPATVPGGARIIHCADPQGAVFALLDRRIRTGIRYVVPRAPSDAGGGT
jgi:predicted enzyme related to lactoylglutathione lyase